MIDCLDEEPIISFPQTSLVILQRFGELSISETQKNVLERQPEDL